jgi:hypothetical protein
MPTLPVKIRPMPWDRSLKIKFSQNIGPPDTQPVSITFAGQEDDPASPPSKRTLLTADLNHALPHYKTTAIGVIPSSHYYPTTVSRTATWKVCVFISKSLLCLL